MPTIDPKPLTRDQLASFLGGNELVRRFERLFKVAGELTPAQIELIFTMIDEVSTGAGLANTRAAEALSILEGISSIIDRAAKGPAGFSMPRSFPVDYIDFDGAPPHAAKPHRIAWSSDEDTLNIYHNDGVTQQVGQELYARFFNNTGAMIPNGTCIGINPVTNAIVTYIADGSLSSFGIVGVATQDIPNNAFGRTTVWGRLHDLNTTGAPYGEAWAAGDLLYVSTTVAGGFTKTKPTAPAVSIPIGRVISAHATTGIIFVRPVPEQQLYYGAFTKLADQVPTLANTAQALLWTNTESANGVSIGAPASRLVMANAGLYKASISLQLTSSSASVKNVWIWFRKNGVDVPNSSIIVSLNSATAIRAPSRALYFSMMANDYIEVMFASDSTAMTVDNIAATGFAPAAPAAIITINQEQQ